jgi:hypothetical protein
MRNRLLLLALVKVAALSLLASACGGGGAGKIMADTPAIPFEAADAD